MLGLVVPTNLPDSKTNPPESHVLGALITLLSSPGQLPYVKNVRDVGGVLEGSDSGKREGGMEGTLQGQKGCFGAGTVTGG